MERRLRRWSAESNWCSPLTFPILRFPVNRVGERQSVSIRKLSRRQYVNHHERDGYWQRARLHAFASHVWLHLGERCSAQYQHTPIFMSPLCLR
jgi:hypothetical protein